MKRYSIVPTATGNVMRQTKCGSYVLYEEAADLQRQLTEVTRERGEWKLAYAAQQQVVQDIGTNLGAKVPYELVNSVARRRMVELAEVTRERDTLKAMVELHDAMNDRRRLAQETPHKRRQYENG